MARQHQDTSRLAGDVSLARYRKYFLADEDNDDDDHDDGDDDYDYLFIYLKNISVIGSVIRNQNDTVLRKIIFYFYL